MRGEHALVKHAGLAFCCLLLVYLAAELGYSLSAPLWHDELFTFYIAQALSVRSMLSEIRTVDLNPPLSYLLTRLSFRLFGVGTLQCRLPEIAGFALALLSIFCFVGRRAGSAFGLLAAALLFGSRAGELVFQARPYGLLLGTGAAALACWQAASLHGQRRSRLAEAGLFLSLTALLSTHIFGIFVWASLAAGEAVAIGKRRRWAPLRLLALVLPLGVTLLYLPLLHNHAQAAFPSAFQPGGTEIFLFYVGHVDRELIALTLAAAVIALTRGRAFLRGSAGFVLTGPEWVAVSSLTAAPLFLIGTLIVSHGAFFDRYGVVACLGTAVLFSVLFCWWTGGRASAAAVALVMCLLVTQRLPNAITAVARGQILQRTEPRVSPLAAALFPDPTLPVVAASGLTFLEMQRREPRSLLQRIFYLTDPGAALREAHATIFEGMPEEARLFHLAGEVMTYPAFLRAHPVFYVLGTYDYPEDWLLRTLQEDGAQLTVLGRADGAYKDHEIYRVSMPVSAGLPVKR